MTRKRKSPAFKTMGVLGGMGAATSADFYQEVVHILQREYGAEQDTDFPPMFIYNLPLSGFDETGFADEELVKKQLLEGVQRLAKTDCDFIVIPCNTVHLFCDQMQEVVKIPILSIIEAMVDEVDRRNYKKTGLLTSESTRRYALYESVLRERGLAFISATEAEQRQINEVVRHAIAGTQGERESANLQSIIARFQHEGVQAIILGCTELPLAIKQKDCPLPLLNSTRILAETAIRYARSTGQ